MIRPILPPVLPPITPIVKVAAADFVLQIAAGAVILGIFTLAVWIMLRHSKKDLNEPIIPAALVAYAGVGLILLLVHGISIAAIQGLILCAILLWASLSDIAKHEVPDFITAAILILAFVGFEPANLPSMLIGAAVVFTPQLLVSILRPKRAIGGADIKISTAIAFLLGAEKGIFALLTGMMTGVIVMLIVRKIRKETNVEPFALAFRDVYTFGPAFRAEHSNTARHASEFWMVEPEIAFADLSDNMDLIEDCVKYCINYVLKSCPDEMNFFNTMIDNTLLERLNHVLNSEFKRMSYTEGVEILKQAVKDGHKFDYDKIEWGMDLQSEHERYLTEQVVKGPLFLTDYPAEIKAFYMRLNDDGKTVAACDLLVPMIGELVGGSQREERYELLKKKMEELGNDKELEWYLDTRRYGGCRHSGFGIGFDRLLMYITGMNNIRDVQPYPRTSGSIKY